MKSFLVLILFGIFLVVCCSKQQPQPQQTYIDTVNSGDSTVSGTAGITPDTGDNTLPMDSTAYDVDSIKNSK